MSSARERRSVLADDDLREIDQLLLDYLSEGRVTPYYARQRLAEDLNDYSRGYVRERLARFVDHDHARNLGGGLYELVNDPRDD